MIHIALTFLFYYFKSYYWLFIYFKKKLNVRVNKLIVSFHIALNLTELKKY